MGSQIFSIIALAIGVTALADILIHPQGTQAAANGLASITTPAQQGLLGATAPGYTYH